MEMNFNFELIDENMDWVCATPTSTQTPTEIPIEDVDWENWMEV